jgi:stage II sporulation protein P
MKAFIKKYKYSIFSGALVIFMVLNLYLTLSPSFVSVVKGFSLLSVSPYIPFRSFKETGKSESYYEVITTPDTEAAADIKEEDLAVLGVPSETQEVSEENRGIINEVQYTSKVGGVILPSGAGFIKNSTNHSNEATMDIIKDKPSFRLKLDGSIEVLILHTHATECYNPYDSGVFDKSIPSRSTDNEKNMVRVGATLAKELTLLGVGVVHATTQHDHPSFSGAYNREAETVAAYREKYPSIKVIIDLHRDAIEPSADTRVKPTAVINGKKAAQIMILSGCENGYMNFPDWAENLRFNALLEDKIESAYPGLTRPVYFNYSKYNQNLLTGATLIEMGSHANTISEAVYSAELIAKPIYEALKELKE